VTAGVDSTRASTEQISASAQELAQTSEALTHLLDRFRLRA
jgi:methyl-accepting chemotaxis protein